jgi:hypothetical protein
MSDEFRTGVLLMSMERMPYCSADVDDHDFLKHELSHMRP